MVRSHSLLAVALSAAMAIVTACGSGATFQEDGAGQGGQLTKVTAGYVSAMDQIGLPVGVEAGFFEDEGLDVELSQPFPTGVDSLNALQSGEVDFIQVGTPAIGAAQQGMDLALLGNYTGSATQRSIDETMAVVTASDTEIDVDKPASIRGTRFGVSVGSINHLYLLGLLREAGLAPSDVEIVNTAPPDMAVALETGGIDAAVVWDPWPVTITKQVADTKEVLRGGGYIPFVGYIIATREFAEDNPEVVKRFLTARAAVDRWMRQNPDDAAEAATRWLPGTELDVAREAMRHNIKQLDPRFSACNYLALDTVARLLAEQDVVQPGFDVAKYFMPDPLLTVMRQRSQLFDDLPEIPGKAAIDSGYEYDREAASSACPS